MSEATGKTLLGLKLDQIASLIADETIANQKDITLVEKCAVLKTLDAHYAVVHKIEPSEEVGGAFAKYRKTVATASSGGTGSSGNAERGRSPAVGTDLGSDTTESLELD
jgi:hypothetical protein